MKIIAKLKDGKEIEFDKVTAINGNCKAILMRTQCDFTTEQTKSIEKKLAENIGENVILIPSCIDKIVAIK